MKINGFSKVPDHELERLLTCIHRRTLRFPISRSDLIACAFGDIEEHLDLLIGLEPLAAQRVLVAVLGERRSRKAVPPVDAS